MPAAALVSAALTLRESLRPLRFAEPVDYVYQPLDYAWAPHEAYLRRFGGQTKRVVFIGMNPGPFGMTQTGVPFGEIAAVRDWMGIREPVGKPEREHPKRPVRRFRLPAVRSQRPTALGPLRAALWQGGGLFPRSLRR
jgi:single-strand selective monofunctional uracil DNA glycosylase